MAKSSMVRVSQNLEQELKQMYRQYCLDHGEVSFTEFTERFSLSMWLKRKGHL